MSTSSHRLPAPYSLSTILMCLLFGTNFILFIFYQIIKLNQTAKSSTNTTVTKSKDGKKDKGHEKELSKPFDGSLEACTNLTSELFRVSLIMLMTYVCEYLWIFDHSTKSYSRDLFVFVLIIFFAYGYYTIKPISNLALLGREQTEEWKGWMQFIFLLYHYFHAEEVYNSVRVMITCYVWMTGFGNFSFFYTKNDFSWLRLVQMLWRLNFSVLLLMWTHNNTYILYYICPLHTFYFLMVYVTMYIFSSINTTKWGIRVKLFILALVIYLVWDINGGLFDTIFAFLGTDSVVGAKSGSVWEYYFRTSLDHYSTLFGMIFALNFPLNEQYFTKAKGAPLYVTSILMAIVFVWWYFNFYSMEKFSYNLTHSYSAIIPLTAYIFFRNITPYVRSGVSMSFHDLGKTTLETYLLQHHIWLSSNAKTLWTVIPDHPWVNFALATIIFFIVSKELYRLTMSIRGMILPDDKNIAFYNGIGMVIIVLVFAGLANVLFLFNATWLEISIACTGLSVIIILLLPRLSSSAMDHSYYQQFSSKFIVVLGGVFAVMLLMQMSLGSETHPLIIPDQNTPLLAKPVATYKGNTPACLDAVTHGSWIVSPCADGIPAASSVSISSDVAHCSIEKWVWNTTTPDCPVGRLATKHLQRIFSEKDVVFIGDSVIRSAFHQFIAILEPNYKQSYELELKHSDIRHVAQYNNNTTITFIWAPFVKNITEVIGRWESKKSPHFIVAGAMLWDALYDHDPSIYSRALDQLVKLPALQRQFRESMDATGGVRGTTLRNSTSAYPIKVWLLPTEVLDDRLPTPEKRQYLQKKSLAGYQQAVMTHTGLRSTFHAIIDSKDATYQKEENSIDGIHFTNEVYRVIAYMISNVYTLQFPEVYEKSFFQPKVKVNKAVYTPKPTGSMSSPSYGAAILALIWVMLFLMDSWLGLGYIGLALFGRSYDWDGAYIPLHQKLFGSSTNTTHSTTAEKNQLDESHGPGHDDKQPLLHGKHNLEVEHSNTA